MESNRNNPKKKLIIIGVMTVIMSILICITVGTIALLKIMPHVENKMEAFISSSTSSESVNEEDTTTEIESNSQEAEEVPEQNDELDEKELMRQEANKILDEAVSLLKAGDYSKYVSMYSQQALDALGVDRITAESRIRTKYITYQISDIQVIHYLIGTEKAFWSVLLGFHGQQGENKIYFEDTLLAFRESGDWVIAYATDLPSNYVTEPERMEDVGKKTENLVSTQETTEQDVILSEEDPVDVKTEEEKSETAVSESSRTTWESGEVTYDGVTFSIQRIETKKAILHIEAVNSSGQYYFGPHMGSMSPVTAITVNGNEHHTTIDKDLFWEQNSHNMNFISGTDVSVVLEFDDADEASWDKVTISITSLGMMGDMKEIDIPLN